MIEDLPFPDQMFDLVLSTIMMHHLGDGLKRQGFAEITRVLKPGGRLVIADFMRPAEGQDKLVGLGGARMGTVRDLSGLIKDAGFSQGETEEMEFPKFQAGVGFVRAYKR